jgi:hypothetical protein
VEAPVEEPEGECTYRTQTQGGWGSSCAGGNNGCYRDDHFEECFDEVVIGDLSCNYARFTSSSAIESFLPSGGPPQAIDGQYENPDSSEVDGVLAGQLLAALLNVGFDQCDSTFSSCRANISSLCFLSGDCEDYSVEQVIAAAQYLIGDCPSECTAAELPEDLCTLTLSEINTCLTTFNQAFDGGQTSSTTVGTCPTVESSGNPTSDAKVTAYCAGLVFVSALVAWF